eukprot:443590_1
MATKQNTNIDNWSSLIEIYGFLKPSQIRKHSIEQCIDKNDKTHASNCASFERIKYILEYYHKWCEENTNKLLISNYINNKLNCYDITSLLDDYNHILTFHIYQNDEFEYMFNELNKCSIIHCDIFLRNEQKYKNHGIINKDIDLYNNVKDATEILCIDILDQIHCSLYHQYDLCQLTMFKKTNNSNDLLTIDTVDKIRHITATFSSYLN